MAGDKQVEESRQEKLLAFAEEIGATPEDLDHAGKQLREKLRASTGASARAASTPEAAGDSQHIPSLAWDPDRRGVVRASDSPGVSSPIGGRPALDTAPRTERVPFLEATEQIEKASGPNLREALHEKALKLVRWGDLEPTGVAEYEAKFNAATINVAEVLAALQAGRALRAHFDLGHRGHAEHFKHRIEDGGVRTNEWAKIDGFHKIDAKTGKQIREENTPRIAFSDDTLGPPRDFRGDNKGKHADHWLRQTKDHGQQWLTPQMWMDDFLARADHGLRELEQAKGEKGANIDELSPQAYKELLQKTLLDPNSGIDEYLPDTQTATTFPEYRNASGRVLGLLWDPDRHYRGVSVCDYDPVVANTLIGPRPALG